MRVGDGEVIAVGIGYNTIWYQKLERDLLTSLDGYYWLSGHSDGAVSVEPVTEDEFWEKQLEFDTDKRVLNALREAGVEPDIVRRDKGGIEARYFSSERMANLTAEPVLDRINAVE